MKHNGKFIFVENELITKGGKLSYIYNFPLRKEMFIFLKYYYLYLNKKGGIIKSMCICNIAYSFYLFRKYLNIRNYI